MKVKRLGYWVKFDMGMLEDEQAFTKWALDQAKENIRLAKKKVPRYAGVRATRVDFGYDGTDFINNLQTMVVRLETLTVKQKKKSIFSKMS